MIVNLTLYSNIHRAQFLFENVSNGPAFLWKTQIQTIEYGLNDMIRIKKKVERTHLHTRYEFSNDIDAQSDFGKIFVT